MKHRFDIVYVGMLPPHPGGSGISWAQLLSGFAAGGHRVRALAPITEADRQGGDVFAERRPDIVLIGRETFALHVPDFARAHAVPCIQGIRGNTTVAILRATCPPELAREMLAQFAEADLLVSAAQHMTEGLRRLGIARITTIANAVDVGQFAPTPADPGWLARLGLGPDDVVVLHVSNLKAVKRPLDLVRAAALAWARDRRLAFVIVGDGAQRRAMEEDCRRLGVESRFRFVGWVEHARVPAYLHAADLVVMPSESEGLSRVYLETMACGRLLVASDIAPARELVEDGVTGLLFGVGDVEALAAKIVQAAADGGKRQAIGERARRRALEHALDAAITAYEREMASLVGQQEH